MGANSFPSPFYIIFSIHLAFSYAITSCGQEQRHTVDEVKPERKVDRGIVGNKSSNKKTTPCKCTPHKGGDPQLAKQLCESVAKDNGVLGLLKCGSGHRISSIFASESYGAGGIGLAGSGRRGGGTGEGKVYSNAKTKPKERVKVGRLVVHGCLDQEIIKRKVQQHLNEVHYCFGKEIQGEIARRLMVQFTIAAKGQVESLVIEKSMSSIDKAGECIAQIVRSWSFTNPKGCTTRVSYPYLVRDAGNAEKNE
jgi:hypothetical protein